MTERPSTVNEKASTTATANSVDQSANVSNVPSKPADPPPPYSVFTRKQKWLLVALTSYASLFSPLTANIYFPAIPTLARAFHTSIEKINITVTVYMVMQGISPMVWGTFADRWGRRPMFLGCMLILSLSCVGLALVPTDAYWLLVVLRCLQAAGSASTVALSAGVISDIATAAERGGFFGVSGTGSLLGPCIGPVIGGALSQGLGWRSIFWFLCIASALSFVLLFCVLPETLRCIVGNGSYPPPRLYRTPFSFVGSQPAARSDKPPPKPFINPFRLFLYPDIDVLLLFFGLVYAVFYGVTATLSSLFSEAYPFLSEADLGLVFLSIGGGMVVGTTVMGKLLDWDYARFKRKLQQQANADTEKHGASFMDDEDTFPIERARLRLLPYLLGLCIICVLGYGWSLQTRTSIAVPLILQFIIGVTFVAISNCCSTLMLDLVPGGGGTVTACNNLVRCSLGAVCVSVVNPILQALKPGWTYILLGGICILASPLIWVEIHFGPRWRAHRREKQNPKASNPT